MSALDSYLCVHQSTCASWLSLEAGECSCGLNEAHAELEVIRKNMKEATDMIKFIIKYYDETVDGLWVQNAITNLAKWGYK